MSEVSVPKVFLAAIDDFGAVVANLGYPDERQTCVELWRRETSILDPRSPVELSEPWLYP
jgi:hypothetical protein